MAAPLFVLELYYERDSQIHLAEIVSAAHQTLVNHLAPHLQLEIRVSKASQITRSSGNYQGRRYDVPNQQPSSALHQSLLITNEQIGYDGLAGPRVGCVSEQALCDKIRKAGNPADITVHEWPHTLEGVIIRGEPLPSPDSSSMHDQFPQTEWLWSGWSANIVPLVCVPTTTSKLTALKDRILSLLLTSKVPDASRLSPSRRSSEFRGSKSGIQHEEVGFQLFLGVPHEQIVLHLFDDLTGLRAGLSIRYEQVCFQLFTRPSCH